MQFSFLKRNSRWEIIYCALYTSHDPRLSARIFHMFIEWTNFAVATFYAS